MGVNAVLLSNIAIRRTDSRWGRSGKMPIIIIRANPTKKKGAKACTHKAALHRPWINRTIAVLNPQPGHCTPSDVLIGHCQPGIPIAVSQTCSAATPTNMSMIRRFWIRGGKTGVNKNFVIRDRIGSRTALEINPWVNVEIRPCFIFQLSACGTYICIRKKTSICFRSLK